MVQLSHPYMTTGKTIALTIWTFFNKVISHLHMTTGKTIGLTIWTFFNKVISLLFNMLSRFVIAFFSKEQASFNFMAAVTVHSDFGAQENKFGHCLHYFPIYLPWTDGTGCHDLCFLNVELQASLFILLFHFLMKYFSFLHFLSLGWYHLHIWGYWYFSLQSWYTYLWFIQPGILHDVLCI